MRGLVIADNNLSNGFSLTFMPCAHANAIVCFIMIVDSSPVDYREQTLHSGGTVT